MIRRAKYQVTKFVVPVCLAALAAHGLVNVGAQEQTERAPLNNGVPVTARLSKGETHRYPLTLTVGQYAEVEAKALSGDITLELTAPDGKRTNELDNSQRRYLKAIPFELWQRNLRTISLRSQRWIR